MFSRAKGRSAGTRGHQRHIQTLERLESRVVLSSWPDVFARFEGSIDAGETADILPVRIRREDFQVERRSIVIGFDLRGAAGSLFDPGTLTLLLDQPGDARIFHRDPEALNATASVLLADVRPGTYEIEVKADAGLIGPYELGWYLAGDVNGNGAVTDRDVRTIRQNIGARTGQAGVPLAADVDRDGRVTRDDLRYAMANLGVRTRIKPIRLQAGIDTKQADPERNGLITRGDVEIEGRTTAFARVQLDVGDDGTFETTVAADRAGRFSATVLVGLGRTTVRVVATDAIGQTTEELVQIVRTDEVLTWNEVALVAFARAGVASPRAARALGMMHAAINDTLAAFDDSVKPYHVETDVTPSASREAAIAIAAQTVLAAAVPGQRHYLNTAVGGSLAPLPRNAARREGIALGNRVAHRILKLRANDGSSNRSTFSGGTAVGQWRPTPPGNAAGQQAGWGQVAPFLLRSGDAERAPAPPDVSSGDYAGFYDDVKAIGRSDSATRTADQTAAARFWAGYGADLGTVAVWNRLAREAAIDAGMSTVENARAFLMLDLALADAAIASYDSKYVYSSWRPITAIREGDVDGNDATAGDASWSPLLATPATPSYVSEQSAYAGAAEVVLSAVFGTGFAPVVVSSSGGGGARGFASLADAAEEAGRSQVYAGIAFEVDNQRGLTMGRGVGRLAVQVFG